MDKTSSGCGGACACKGETPAATPADTRTDIQADAQTDTQASVAQVNGVALNTPDEALDEDTLRQRACSELLRQEAMRAGLLDRNDPPGAVPSEAASDAIEALLERELALPEPEDAACERHYQAHLVSYRTGERVRARHVLFAVTQGTDVVALRQRAEACLLDLRCHDGDVARADARFAQAASELSNCPSGAQGGKLGWLTAADCAAEFARELFALPEIGVLPRLVHSRYGLHVVEVQERESGMQQPFAAVRAAVRQSLRQQTYVTALRQYLALLAGSARIEGVQLDRAASPLLQ